MCNFPIFTLDKLILEMDKLDMNTDKAAFIKNGPLCFLFLCTAGIKHII